MLGLDLGLVLGVKSHGSQSVPHISSEKYRQNKQAPNRGNQIVDVTSLLRYTTILIATLLSDKVEFA